MIAGLTRCFFFGFLFSFLPGVAVAVVQRCRPCMCARVRVCVCDVVVQFVSICVSAGSLLHGHPSERRRADGRTAAEATGRSDQDRRGEAEGREMNKHNQADRRANTISRYKTLTTSGTHSASTRRFDSTSRPRTERRSFDDAHSPLSAPAALEPSPTQ